VRSKTNLSSKKLSEDRRENETRKSKHSLSSKDKSRKLPFGAQGTGNR